MPNRAEYSSTTDKCSCGLVLFIHSQKKGKDMAEERARYVPRSQVTRGALTSHSILVRLFRYSSRAVN